MGQGSAESLVLRLCGFSACHVRVRALITKKLFNIKSRRVCKAQSLRPLTMIERMIELPASLGTR